MFFIKNGPAIILPKHRSYVDGLLSAYYIKTKTKRYCSFFAKSTLPSWLESVGGIKFVTRKDFEKLSEKIGREKAKQIAKQINRESYAKIEDYLQNNELIIMFPEGKINAKKMSKLNINPFKYFEQMQEKLSTPISLVPAGLEYSRLYYFKKHASFLPIPKNLQLLDLENQDFLEKCQLKNLLEKYLMIYKN